MSPIPLILVLALLCPLQPPVAGAVLRPFAPQGSYGGHWGIDLAADPGTAVKAAAAGTVTFAGSVGGRLSVTIHHGGGVRTSYSYLFSIYLKVGDAVAIGDPVGTSGEDHGLMGVHFSLRVDSIYLPPPIGNCALLPGRGLRLGGESPSGTYPRPRATRHSRRHLRSASLSPPFGW